MIKIILLLYLVAATQAAGLLAPDTLYGPPVSYPGYPYNNYRSQPAIASQQANVFRSPFNLGQVSTFSKAIDTPFSSVRKADIRVSNPGLALAPAYQAAPLVPHITAPTKVATSVLGVAYSAAPAVSHMAYTNGLGYSYGW